jgi:peroxiredoxin
VDSQRKMKSLHERYEIPFNFVADRSAKITTSYNVYLTEKHPDHDRFQINHAIPSKFLINKEGVIVWQYIGAKTDRPPIEMLIEAIESNL